MLHTFKLHKSLGLIGEHCESYIILRISRQSLQVFQNSVRKQGTVPLKKQKRLKKKFQDSADSLT